MSAEPKERRTVAYELRYGRGHDLAQTQTEEHFAREERRVVAFERIADALAELVKRKTDVFR